MPATAELGVPMAGAGKEDVRSAGCDSPWERPVVVSLAALSLLVSVGMET